MKRALIGLFLCTLLLSCGDNGEPKHDKILEEATNAVESDNSKDVKSGHLSNHSVYVTAKNGLTYRGSPDVNSDRLGKFDLGAKLKVLKKTGVSFELEENGRMIKGEWLKVALQDYDWKKPFEPQSGYVFSGYTVDSLEAAHLKLPIYIDHLQSRRPTVETAELLLSFEPIDSTTFHAYPKVAGGEFTGDSTKRISESKGGCFLLETNKSTVKFSCRPYYTRPCHLYIGYCKPLNAFLIGTYGDGVYSTYLLDKGDDSVFNLFAEKDDGDLTPILSPTHQQMATYETANLYDSKEYYGFRTHLSIYDLKGISHLGDLKRCYQYTNNDWEIWDFKWIDENSFALQVFEKDRVDEKGNRFPLNSRYLKARIKS